MLGFNWNVGNCCCTGNLDVFPNNFGSANSTASDEEFFRWRSVTTQVGQTDPTAGAAGLWKIPTGLGETSYMVGVVAVRGNHVYEINVRDSLGENPVSLIKFDLNTRSRAWTSEAFNYGYRDDFMPSHMYFGPGAEGVIRSDSHVYLIYDTADGSVDVRENLTAGASVFDFTPDLDAYGEDVQLGNTPVPQVVSRWEYPACAGLAFESYSWSEGSSTATVTWKVVAGDVDWTTESMPRMTEGDTLASGNAQIQVSPPFGGPTPTHLADVQKAVFRLLTGNGTAYNDYRSLHSGGEIPQATFITSPSNFSGMSGLAGRSSVAGILERHRSGANGLVLSTKTRAATVTTKVALYVDGLEVLDLGSIGSFGYGEVSAFLPVNDDDVAFIVSRTGDGMPSKVYAIAPDGDVVWSQTSQQSIGQAMCASDRYIYLSEFVLDRDAMVGPNLPEFTAGPHFSPHGAGTWGDWMVSIDGTRYNPARYRNFAGRLIHSFNGNYLFESIKDSNTLTFAPPDAWF